METLFADYAPKGVRFYYLYKALAHPELNGYVKPVTLDERFMHIREAQRTLGSKITWICDTMGNDAKHALGNRPNSEFVIDPDGIIVRMRTWSNPGQLREDLEELVGPVETPTQVGDLDMPTRERGRVAPQDVVPRVQAPGRMVPLKLDPLVGDTPHYAKLRAEVTADFFREGKGTMYLGFHMDPIYRVHWNNLVDPIQFELTPPKGVVLSPASGTGPKVDVESDSDPREFLVEIEGAEATEPIELTARYFACNSDEGWCIPVTQIYAIILERDRDGGSAFGRGRPGGQRERAAGPRNVAERIRSRDRNGDGVLGRDEVPEQMARRFDEMDSNGDGTLDEAELSQFVRRGPGGGGRGPGMRPRNPEALVARMMQRDQDGDGKISRDEASGPMARRFDRMDSNGDGFVDKDEIAEMARRFGSRNRPNSSP
ncbi:MAG: EF-hand domain-containing protein [Candidatus Latescibacteria bacterium]|nr:EF-hand domain-containing protein [Candidatus Latescibacterota bacterium]